METIKEVISWLVVLTIMVSMSITGYTQYKMLQFLEHNQAVEEWQPQYDPCGLATVDCDTPTTTPDVTQNADAEALEVFLIGKGAYELAEHSEAIVGLHRWEEVVGIALKETSLCTAGVGSSKNNCGAIMSWRTDRVFKEYENVYDSLWDVAYLLQKPRYEGKTIEEMNGIYCVHDGGKCPNWSEVIEKTAGELRELAYDN